MTKWSAVIIGFLLTVLLKAFIPQHSFIGLLIIGFLVGYMAKDGALGGLWHAALAGALGTIIESILFIITATFGGGFFGLTGGLTGFTLSGFTSIITIIGDLIYYAVVMGITGAVGGAIASKN